MLYDSNAARLCIGCLLQNPKLLNNDKYNLTKEDFELVEYHMRLFQVIVWLLRHGAQQIETIDLYNASKKYPKIIELFDENNTKDFVSTLKKLSNPNNFDVYYEEVKKNSILRDYKAHGFDISKFESNISKYTLKEIIDYYDGLQIAIKKRFYKDKNIEETKAGEGFEEIKSLFMKEPMFGASTFSEYVNTASRGWINGQLTIYSMASGTGKTSIGLYNLVKVCSPALWDFKTGQYIKNPCYQHKSGLFLQYEMNAQYELTPRLIASISGVPTYHILNGVYGDGEEKRVDIAIDILKKSNIYIVTMPSFTIGLIESYIKDYVLNKNVGYVVFDYISEQASVSSDIARKNGVAIRSDQVLSSISRTLKDIAVENNVAIMTFTQVNANATMQDILDAGCIAGSRAVQDKADIAAIVMPLRKKEQEVCEMIMGSQFPDSKIRPNRIIHLYKMRFTSEEQGIKIWVYVNLSTGRVTDFWATDKYDKPYELSKTKLEYK